MITRQQEQIKRDFIKAVNNMNDLLDCAARMARRQDPQRQGKVFKVPKTMEDLLAEGYSVEQIRAGISKEVLEKEPSIDELKDILARAGQNVLGYRNEIDVFIEVYGATETEEALTACGFDCAGIMAEVSDMASEADRLKREVGKVEEEAGFAAIADHIDSNIPKLPLVRRPWSLGV